MQLLIMNLLIKIDIINNIVMYLSYILYYIAKRSVLHIEQLL